MSKLSFIPALSFSRIDALQTSNGSKATFLSGLNYGGDLIYSFAWSHLIKSYVQGGFVEIGFLPASGRDFTNASQIYWRGSGGVVFDVSKNWALTLGLGGNDEVFYHATSATNDTFDRLFIWQLSTSAQYHFLRWSDYLLTGRVDLAYLAPSTTASESVHSGMSSTASLNLRRQFKDSHYSVLSNLLFGYSRQSTSLYQEARMDFGLSIGVARSFGP